MTTYVDSSVVLRIVFGEPGRLEAFDRVEYGVASEILKIECLRTIDSYRSSGPR